MPFLTFDSLVQLKTRFAFIKVLLSTINFWSPLSYFLCNQWNWFHTPDFTPLYWYLLLQCPQVKSIQLSTVMLFSASLKRNWAKYVTLNFLLNIKKLFFLKHHRNGAKHISGLISKSNASSCLLILAPCLLKESSLCQLCSYLSFHKHIKWFRLCPQVCSETCLDPAYWSINFLISIQPSVQ